MQNKMEFRDYVFYAVLLSLLVWVYMKKAGYFNTPILLEIYPFLGMIFMAGVIYQRFINLENQVIKNMKLIAKNYRLIRENSQAIKENQVILRERSNEIKFLMGKIN